MHVNLANTQPHINLLKNKELKLFITKSIRSKNSRQLNKTFQASPNLKAILLQSDSIQSIPTKICVLHDL